MNNDCDIIRDLCILVKEEACSESSKRLVEEHLNECSECKNYYDSLDEEIDIEKDKLQQDIISNNKEVKNVVKYSKKVFKRSLVVVSCIIGAMLIYIIVVYGWLFGIGAAKNIWGDSYETKDIKEYMKFNHIQAERVEIRSNLDIFPKSIENETSGYSYYYYCDDKGLLDNKYQMYLEKIYSQQEFEIEKERLARIETNINGNTQKVKYNEKDFKFPAYVAIYADDFTYEYALIDEESKKIIYVYTRFMNEKDIEFDKVYLPINFEKDMEPKEPYEKGFNIYSFDSKSVVEDIINE